LGAGGIALWLNGASSNTFSVVYASATSYGAALYPNSSFNTFTYSTFSTNGSGLAALYLNGASSNTFTSDYIRADAAGGAYLAGASNGNLIQNSTITTNAASKAAFYAFASATNTVTGSVLRNNAGYGAWLAAGSSGTVVSYSTVTNSNASFAGIKVDSPNNQLIADWVAQVGNNNALWITSTASATSVSQSTITSGGTGFAVFMIDSSSNVVSGSYVYNLQDQRALWLTTGASSNTVTGSTITSLTQNFYAFEIDSSSNLVTRSVIANPTSNGKTALLLNAAPRSTNNTISFSSITSGTSGQAAVDTAGGAKLVLNNLFTDDFIFNAAGPAVKLGAAAAYNTIAFSTLTNKSGSYGLYLLSDAFDTFTSDYIQGSTAVYAFNSSGTVVGASVLAATSASGKALNIDGFWTNFKLSSSVLSAGSQGYDVYLGTGGSGLIVLSSNTISGGQYGIYIATKTASTQVWITSNTVLPPLSAVNDTFGIVVNGLTSGATIQNNDVFYRTSGSQSGFKTVGLYTQSVSGLNIDHNRISNPGMVKAGSVINVLFSSGTALTSFNFNDVHSTGTGLTAAYLLQVDASTISYIANNIFMSSLTATSSATIWINPNSGFSADYNDYFSSNSLNTLAWGGVYTFPWNVAVGTDSHSLAVDPIWAATRAGIEDFHPKSATGRWNQTTQSLSNVDTAESLTIDAGDPLESSANEPAPNGGVANQGSYGNTAQASQSAALPIAPSIFTIGASSITVAFTTTQSSSYAVQASSKSDFTGVLFTSATATGASRLAPQGLNPNTTYYLRAGATYGPTTLYSATILSTAALAQLVNGTTVYQVSITSMAVNWIALANDVSSNSSVGYTLQVSTRADFTPLYTSSATLNLALSTLTASGLTGGVTYYFRVGTYNVNLSPNYTTSVSTLMPVQLGVFLSTHALTLPGLTNLNATILISTSIIISNTGNVPETYYLSATTSTALSPWKIAASTGQDRFELWTVINSTAPSSADYGAADVLSDTESACSPTAFTMGNQTCYQAPIGASNILWMQLATPVVTTTNAAQTILINARAVKDP
jgi:hypothetical protein